MSRIFEQLKNIEKHRVRVSEKIPFAGNCACASAGGNFFIRYRGWLAGLLVIAVIGACIAEYSASTARARKYAVINKKLNRALLVLLARSKQNSRQSAEFSDTLQAMRADIQQSHTQISQSNDTIARLQGTVSAQERTIEELQQSKIALVNRVDSLQQEIRRLQNPLIRQKQPLTQNVE